MGFKIGIIIVVIFGLLLWFGDDDDTELEEDNTTQESEAAEVDAGDEDTSWAIYWYLCGSDLESDGGCATTDLEEMMDVELPDVTYEMLYKMYDCQGNTAYSDVVEFEYKNGEITTTVFE